MFEVTSISYWLALANMGLQIVTAGLLVLFLADRNAAFKKYTDLVTRWGLRIGFLVALGAALTAQLYESIGYLPCYWCWWGRIFHYPLIVLFGIAAWRRDANIAIYAMVLATFGALVTFYLHSLQMGWVTSGPCVVGGVDCAARTFFQFGYITFPLMQFSMFVFFIVLMLFQIRRREA